MFMICHQTIPFWQYLTLSKNKSLYWFLVETSSQATNALERSGCSNSLKKNRYMMRKADKI